MCRTKETFVSRNKSAWVAQLVEHFPEEEGVGGSSPPPSTYEKTPSMEFFHMCLGSKAPARFTCGLERRRHVALRQSSRGQEYLAELERSEQLCLVTRDRARPFP